jgi:glycosyltransferase involved in cell wall biosynthesis
MVITDDDRRGAQVFAADLRASLAACSDVDLVALAPGTTGGLEVDTLGPRRRSLATLRSLRRRVRDVDVVVAHGSTTLPMCALACAGTATPFVYRQISDSLFWASSRARLVRTRRLLARADQVVTLWSGAAEVLQRDFRLTRSRLTVIPNGVPPDRFPLVGPDDRADARRELDLPETAPVAAYVGALVEEKGVDTLIEAFGRIQDATGAHLLVAGDGPARRQLEGLASTHAPDAVRFVGSLADPWTAYAATDLVAFPSRGGDSMPAVIIEAAFAGVPLVATAVAAIPTMVTDQESALLVASDDVEAMATALEQAMTDPHLRARLAEANRKQALQRYDIDVVAQQWLEVLARVALA